MRKKKEEEKKETGKGEEKTIADQSERRKEWKREGRKSKSRKFLRKKSI